MMDRQGGLGWSIAIALVAVASWTGCTDGGGSDSGTAEHLDDNTQIAQATLEYTSADEDSTVDDQLQIAEADDNIHVDGTLYASQDGIRKAIALTHMVKGLKHGLTMYHQDTIRREPEEYGDPLVEAEFAPEQEEEQQQAQPEEVDPEIRAAGIDEVRRTRDMVAQEAARPGSGSLAQEVELLDQLIANMQQGGTAPVMYEPSAEAAADGFGGGGAAPGAGGQLGATPGGAQDIGYLRRLIEEGMVPAPDHFEAEGLFSEHDLPLEAEACEQMLCISAAHGFGPDFVDGGQTGFIQIGFASGLDAATFERKPLNLSVVIDRSGSMSGDRIEAARTALERLVDQLSPNDRLSLVVFNNEPQVMLEPTMVNDPNAIKSLVRGLEAEGGTDIESGLRQGFAFVDAHRSSAPEMEHRVILITDAQPNIGATGDSEFVELAQDHAQRGIGLTTMGVGVDFGHALALAIGRVRGANMLYLEDAEKLERVFDQDFEYLVTPLAYDLRLDVRPEQGFRIRDVHGIANWDDSTGMLTLDIPTVFVSRNKGAIVIELEVMGGSGNPL
ncbi:MAG: VWA domain-containing protein [Myxococcota bacterium]